MHRVIENINIVRLFSFTILMGVFLSANSNSEYLPAPIPIDFGVNNGMRSDSTNCESCNISYDADTMGAACCDEATQFNSDFTCEVLETTYLWNCSGCACAEDDDNWTTIFGCTNPSACNYNLIAEWDDGSCVQPEENYDCDGNCIVELDECGVCDGDGSSCIESIVSLIIQNVDIDEGTLDIYMTNNVEIGGFQFQLTNIDITGASGGSANNAGFTVQTSGIDVPSGISKVIGFSITGATISAGEGILTSISFTNFTDGEICFGEDTGSAGMNAIADANGGYIAAEWGDCYISAVILGCTDMDACNYNPDATEDDGSCVQPEENYDCDGNCIAEIDCNNECGGSALVDECGVCGGGGENIECWDGSMVCNTSDCPDELTECIDDPDVCIWNTILNYNYNSQYECEVNGGVWGGYLAYFGTSCDEVIDIGEGCDTTILYWSVSDLCPISCGECCDDDSACNDGDTNNGCEYPEDFGACDCDGNVLDDCGVCNGGNASMDECGVCDGSGPEEGFNCEGIPFDFVYNQSTEQAFYHILSAFDLDENPLVPDEDWIGVFNGDICVGARKWTDDISTDIPAMGDDGYWYSNGYLQEGDYPDFQIFDASENQYYAAQLSENYPFSNNGVFSVESLSAGISYSLSLENHHNLVSFYALPDDVSIAGIMSGLGDNALSVITEGSSAINLDGVWTGSLTEITPENGYWISISNFPDNLSVIGFDMDPDRMYDLHEGPNLISFPDSGSADLSSAIPDDVEHLFTAIISEGVSALNSDNGWAGSLTGFQGGAGYWVIVQEDLSFSYNTEDVLARSAHSFSEKLPNEDGFIVAQSSRQAFYYVDDIKLDNGGVEDGDWILSYNNDVLAGIRQWKGNTVDIPNMGFAGDMITAGYFNEGDVPTFKLLRQSTGKIITLEGNIPNWSDNGIFILGELYEKQQIPELFVLNKAYPNPFNPTTTIGFGLPDQSEIIIEIYNLYGKRVEILVDKSIPAGYSSIVWNADKFSSGLYFVKLSANSLKGIKYTNIQKLMLVK